MHPLQVNGLYFDGRSSTPQPIVLQAEGAGLLLTLDNGASTRVPVNQIQVSEKLSNAPRLLHFKDSSFIEVQQRAELDQLLRAIGVQDSWVVRWQRYWPAALAALIGTIVLLALGYQYALPKVAAFAAQRIPISWEERIGQEAVEIADRQLFKPSQLPLQRQQQLREQFLTLVQPEMRQMNWRIEFRASRIGPNAVALPGGLILVTDELVKLAPSDEALIAVIAHELGHVQQRHFLRQMISGFVVGAALTVIAGDVSGVLTAVPATLGSLAYSRDMEREADQFAIDLLRQANRSAEPLAQMLEVLEQAHQKEQQKLELPAQGERKSGSIEEVLSEYLTTHPATPERLESIRRSR